MNFFITYYYIFLVPFLSISVFYGLQYLTRGVDYFINDNGVKWRFLIYLAIAQYFIALLITWGVLSAFSSDFLSDYETLKMSAIIILGGSPFNITILVWVALKLEIYKLMKERYGDNFNEDEFFIRQKKVIKKEEQESTQVSDIQNNNTLQKESKDNNVNYMNNDLHKGA